MLIAKKDEGSKRVVGVPGHAPTVVNNTIGAGIFALPIRFLRIHFYHQIASAAVIYFIRKKIKRRKIAALP